MAGTAPVTQGIPSPTRIVLPADSRIPEADSSRVGLAEEGRRRHSAPSGWLDPYISPLVHIRDDRDRNAWFHFCHGHHMEFLYWQATAMACHRATEATVAGDRAAAGHWVVRAAALVRGSGAMLSFCGAFDSEVYDPLLRDSMAAQRDDFSGDMSVDFLHMMKAKQAMVSALNADGNTAARTSFAAAERYWYHHHGEVVLALHPGDSLLKVKIDALKERSSDFDYRRYIETVVRGEQALRDYDEYFGVDRVPSMPIADYWTQALEKVDVVHHHFALSTRERSLLLVADAVLLGVISDNLASVIES